jgi:hypothetical protein
VKVTSELGKGTAFILTIPNIPNEEEVEIASKPDNSGNAV